MEKGRKILLERGREKNIEWEERESRGWKEIRENIGDGKEKVLDGGEKIIERGKEKEQRR